MVLCTACVIKINVNGYHNGYGHSSRWNRARRRRDIRTIKTAITRSYVDDRKITLSVNKVLGFTILNHLWGMYYGILASLDGVSCHCMPIRDIYTFIPPVIRLLVLAVMDGDSDAHLRPLLINSINDFNNNMILTPLNTKMHPYIW